jgi:hypothetical protein
MAFISLSDADMKNSKWSARLALIALFAAMPALASAQSFRCRGDIANVGDAKVSVLQKCGEPLAKDTFCKPVDQPANPVAAAVCEQVDEWVYNPGYGQFMTTLRFESGRLHSIHYGERVK